MTRYLIGTKNMPLLARRDKKGWVGAFKNPAVFTSKKKAKRILRRLNKYHGGEWYLIKI